MSLFQMGGKNEERINTILDGILVESFGVAGRPVDSGAIGAASRRTIGDGRARYTR